jgi:hypothetical protein
MRRYRRLAMISLAGSTSVADPNLDLPRLCLPRLAVLCSQFGDEALHQISLLHRKRDLVRAVLQDQRNNGKQQARHEFADSGLFASLTLPEIQTLDYLIPAEAGIHFSAGGRWTPAFAGVT